MSLIFFQKPIKYASCGIQNQQIQMPLRGFIFGQLNLLTSFRLAEMGYNSKCIDQNCSAGCCNTYGKCPSTSYSASSLNRNCKYYYTQTTSSSQPLSGGAIAGISIAPIVVMIGLIVGITCCVKKCKENQIKKLQEQRMGNNHNHAYACSNPNLNMTTQHLGTEYTDPNQVMIHNQPAYGQPYGQPYVQPPNNLYGQPMMANPLAPPVYGNPEQAIFGQGPVGFQQPPMSYGQPPLYPSTPNYGPGPIVR